MGKMTGRKAGKIACALARGGASQPVGEIQTNQKDGDLRWNRGIKKAAAIAAAFFGKRIFG